MRVLVTGASGFIGSWVLPALLRRSHEVLALSSRVEPHVDAHGVQWIGVDLLKPGAATAILQSLRPKGMIHCAWDTTPGAYWTSAANLKWVSTSLELLEAFDRFGGRRAVFAGTSAEYDWTNGDSLSEIQSAIGPATLYGVCKDSLRRVIEQWAATRELSWAWGRVFCPFGLGEKPERLVPRLILRLLSGERLPFDSGRLIRDFMCVEDLGDAFAALLDSSLVGTINLASGRDTSIRQLVTSIAYHLGRSSQVEFDVLPDPVGEPARIVADVERLREELKWNPSATPEQRLAQTCDWWQSGNRGQKLVI